MRFEDWWKDIGQRNLAFTAEQWALAGWIAHIMHGTSLDNPALDDDQKLLEDEPRIQN